MLKPCTMSQCLKPGDSGRIRFFDFSSTFNTICPTLLGEKVKRTFSVGSQYVCLQSAVDGTVLSPLLFTLHTSDLRYDSEFWHLQKSFHDNDAFWVETSSERSSFLGWCEDNHQLNISKVKEQDVDVFSSFPSFF